MATGCSSVAANVQNAQTEHTEKIIAIGDLHGDFDAYQALLQQAGLIDEGGSWSGGQTVFIQTGDVPDRGPDSAQIIRHLIKLQKQARKVGGSVITLVGNHEAMIMTGDLRYVDPGEYAAFASPRSAKKREAFYKDNRDNIEKAYRAEEPDLTSEDIRLKWKAANPVGKAELEAAWSPEGEFGKWVRKNPAVAKVGDSLFVHGGISAKYTAYSLQQINALTAKALKAQEISPNSIINDEFGPLWYRGLTKANESSVDQELDLVLKSYGVSRIVIGHTPNLSGIKSSKNGRVIQIDTGISGHYGGTASFLRIENGKLFAHDNGLVRALP